LISKLEITIDELISKALPNYDIESQCYETMYGTRLFFDFCIPSLKVMIEVQGQQHYKFIRFFHGMIENFYKSNARDNLKQEWCGKNGYTLVYFKYDEIAKLTVEEVKARIVNS